MRTEMFGDIQSRPPTAGPTKSRSHGARTGVVLEFTRWAKVIVTQGLVTTRSNNMLIHNKLDLLAPHDVSYLEAFTSPHYR